MRRHLAALAALLLFAVFASAAQAHKPSDAFLALTVTPSGTVEGQWDIALRDLELVLHLDTNGDGAITWGELHARQGDVFGYALSRLTLAAGSAACALDAGEMLVDEHSDGAYAVLRFVARCEATTQLLRVDYRLLFDVDPSHRGLLRLRIGALVQTAVLAPDNAVQEFDVRRPSRWVQFGQFVADGMHHIWVGYDHLLFLISLLLPAVLVRRDGRWLPAPSLRSAFLSVLAVVTAFTVSHSITLSLAALGVIGLPSRLVESGIALSVMLAALNNLWPVVTRRAWLLAGVFGLVHGFGFASVLNDLGLPRDALALALAGFNLGVEFGQLAVVLVVVPIIYLLRRRSLYRPAILVGGSTAVSIIALAWLIQRVFDLRFI